MAKSMGVNSLIIAALVGGALGGSLAYVVATSKAADIQADREQQMRDEMAMMLTAIVDLDKVFDEDEVELLAWKLNSLRASMEDYVRGGAVSPEVFVPEIVGAMEVP